MCTTAKVRARWGALRGAVLGVCMGISSVWAQPIPWIDVHVHLLATDLAGARVLAADAVAFAQSQGMRTVFLFPPPQMNQNNLLDGPEFSAALEEYGNRVAFLGGGASLNPILQEAANRTPSASEVEAYRQRAEVIAKSGAKGFGEIALHHLSMTAKHPYEMVSADHPFLKVLMDVAAAHDLPIDLHFDPILAQATLPEALRGNKNPATFAPNVDGFERLLAYNRAARVVWAHAGGGDDFGAFTPHLVTRLLTEHPNLYLSLRPRSKRPGAILGTGERNDEWLAVIESFPDRFVMGSDSFFVQSTRGGAAQDFAERLGSQTQAIRRVLQFLTPDTAQKVARGNAVRLYHLN